MRKRLLPRKWSHDRNSGRARRGRKKQRGARAGSAAGLQVSGHRRDVPGRGAGGHPARSALVRRGTDSRDSARQIDIHLDGERVLLDGQDVSQEIRRSTVTTAIHYVADNPQVREHLVELQRREAAGRSIVTEGRDQGTVAFPDAQCKFLSDRLTGGTRPPPAPANGEHAGNAGIRPGAGRNPATRCPRRSPSRRTTDEGPRRHRSPDRRHDAGAGRRPAGAHRTAISVVI